MPAPSRSDAVRAQTFERLDLRNAVVGALRLIVPLLGLAALATLIAQIWLANLSRQYGVSGIRIDRGTLVVETPRYAGMGADGSRYVATANEARSSLETPDEITMLNPVLDLSRPGGAPLRATSSEAVLHSGAQRVVVAGTADVASEDGMTGTLADVETDIARGTTIAKGAVALTLADGTTIDSAGMVYDGLTWTFTRATVIVPDLPRGEGAP